MKLLTDLRIGQRLAVSFGLMIVLLIAIGSYGALTASHLAKDLDRTANSSLVKIAAANALDSNVNIIARASRDLLLLDEARQIKKQNAAIAAAGQDSEKQLSSLEAALDTPKEKELITQVREREVKFLAAVGKFQKIQQDGSPDSYALDIRTVGGNGGKGETPSGTEFGGDPARTYATGMSMGGYGTWEVALAAPERFAALVPVCGGVRPPRVARNTIEDPPSPSASANPSYPAGQAETYSRDEIVNNVSDFLGVTAEAAA